MSPEPQYTPAQIQLAVQRVQLRKKAQTFRVQHKRDFSMTGDGPMLDADWYDWQLESFHTDKPQMMLMAGNRSGKTLSAGYHTALDLTGDYPEWWKGYRFTHAPNVMVSGVNNDQLKRVVQKELFGSVIEPEGGGKKQFTGGWVHKEEIGRVIWNKQTTDLANTVEVFSKYGRSHCELKAYTQSKTGMGTLSFAGSAFDLIWVDECPPDDLVGQLLVRLTTGNLNKGGHIRYTMTPELGTTKLVTQFMEHRQDSQHLVGPIAWSQCPHITKTVQDSILSGVPEHEHDMRSKGIPFFGSGLVYNCPEDRIRYEPFEVTRIPYLLFLRGMDLGIDHPTAFAWMAYNPEDDIMYLLKTYSKKGEAAAIHAAKANSYLKFAPMVVPPDIGEHEKGSGKTVRSYYEDAGIDDTIDFENPDGSKYVEPGVLELDDRMKTGRFKVFSYGCEEFWREKRMYHRMEGKLVRVNDDVMSAIRYCAMMIREHGVRLGGHHHHKVKVITSY